MMMHRRDLPNDDASQTGAFLVITRAQALGLMAALALPLASAGLALYLSDARQDERITVLIERVARAETDVRDIKRDGTDLEKRLSRFEAQLVAIAEGIRRIDARLDGQERRTP